MNVLITGASRGIGAETARQFALAGWGVAVNYHRSSQAAHALVEELTAQGCRAVALPGDVSSSREANTLVENAISALEGLDALVCNAGMGRQQLLSDMSDEDWQAVMGVNLDGVFYTIRAVLPHMVHRKQGAIVTLSSMWGVTGGSCEAAYSAAKAGVIGLTRALAKELGPSGIRVNCVAPGVIDTEMNAALTREDLAALADETPLGRIGAPLDVARTILFLCRPDSSFFTGQVLQPNGGIVI